MNAKLDFNLKNIPIDITLDEYMEVAKTIYASFETIASTNKQYHFISLVDKKVYLVDTIINRNELIRMAESKDFAMLNIVPN